MERKNSRAVMLSERDHDSFAISSSDCPTELLCTEDDILELLVSLDVTKPSGPRAR